MSSEKFDISYRLRLVMGDMSQREFAKALEISPSTLWEYLNGRIPPADFIVRVCDTFQICERWLLTGEGPKQREIEISAFGVAELSAPEYGTEPDELTRLKSQLERAYRSGDNRIRGKIQGFLAALDPGEKGV